MEAKYAPPIIDGLNLAFPQGKVRDTFEIPGHPDKLLQVATDRISTHNIVHESLIPGKGIALTTLTIFWIRQVLSRLDIETHLVAHGKDIFNYLPAELAYPPDLTERAIVIKKLNMIPVEFIFRGYLAGSLWKKYASKGLGNPYGVEIPRTLRFMEKFDEPIFTPTDKSETDEPMSKQEVLTLCGEAPYQFAKRIYDETGEYARTCGITIIDGKLEVGIDESTGALCLGDEVITPDSCRFVGGTPSPDVEPKWLDKEYVRAEAEETWGSGEKHPLTFSEETVLETMRRYQNICDVITQGRLYR